MNHMTPIEIIEMLSFMDSMENITRVRVLSGDFEIEVERDKSVSNLDTPVAVAPKEPESPLPTFAPARPEDGFGSPTAAHPLHSNLASEGQRKYATDLANKLGTGDMMNVVYGLAHALEVPADDILHPNQWAESLSRDQADAYLDVLEQQWKKSKRGGFQ